MTDHFHDVWKIKNSFIWAKMRWWCRTIWGTVLSLYIYLHIAKSFFFCFKSLWFKLPKLAGNGTPKRRTPLVFISQPGSAVLIVTSPGSAFTRRFPLCQLDRVREDRVNDGSAWSSGSCRWRYYYLPHGIQIRWKFNFARIHFTDSVIATITRHLCCYSMCITLQRCDSQEMNCNVHVNYLWFPIEF